jgi:glycosyltransferase involved in cell wall biosynthesis
MSDAAGIDILMITYNRPQYTRLALERLLATCDEHMRVWIWQNGSDAETFALVQSLSSHPRVHKFHHSVENKKLREPTNWLWTNAKGDFVCKVDDDCIMPDGWADTLRKAHADAPELGVVGCWRFPDEDFVPDSAHKKIASFAGGHRLMKNLWVEGSGYLMKRACLDRCGPLRDGESFTQYCVRVAAAGWVNGWYYPFLYQEHMDDPRSPNSLLKTDADLQKYLPLSAKNNGVETLAAWQAQLRRSARLLQEAPYDVAAASKPWRRKLGSIKKRLRALVGMKSQW